MTKHRSFFVTHDPAEIERRIAAQECIDCKLPGMTFDPATGFPFRRCGDCLSSYLAEVKAAESKRRSALLRAGKANKQAGLDLLDELLGTNIHDAATPVRQRKHYED